MDLAGWLAGELAGWLGRKEGGLRTRSTARWWWMKREGGGMAGLLSRRSQGQGQGHDTTQARHGTTDGVASWLTEQC